MAYIGNTPAEKFSAFSKQDFTTSATTSYTLDNTVSNANEIALFINHVRQEPTTAYTAAGTALTLTSATTSSDDMYCVYLGKAVQTVNPANGSVDTAQLADGAVETAKINDGAVTSAKLGAGCILQVKSTQKNDDFTTAATSFTDVTGLSVSITPSSTSSKILVMFSITVDNTSTSYGTHIRLMRDSTEIAPARSDANYESSWHKFYGDNNITNVMAYQFLDSPSSSSALNYKLQIKPQAGTSTVNRSGNNNASQAYSHKSASSITVMEIAG